MSNTVQMKYWEYVEQQLYKTVFAAIGIDEPVHSFFVYINSSTATTAAKLKKPNQKYPSEYYNTVNTITPKLK